MAETVANVFTLGRCRATFDDVDLGIVQNCEVKLSKVTHEVKIDAYAAPIDAVDGGWNGVVEFDLLEADFGTILPKLQGLAQETGTYTSGTSTLTATRVTFGTTGGTAAATGELKLQSSIAARTPEKDIRIYKAFLASCEPTLVFNPEEPVQKGFRLKFAAMIDTSEADGDYLGGFGDFSDVDA